MNPSEADHYATLGLARACTQDEIRKAYRLLARRLHPDLNGDSPEARLRTQQLNAAYEVLGDSARRRAYDRELHEASRTAAPGRGARIERNITHEVRLRVGEFLRGSSVSLRVHDAANPEGTENYSVDIPAGTAPGTRLRVPRTGAMTGGFVLLRLKVLPGPRFKVRGSDLQCDLRIDNRCATQGGTAMLQGATGNTLRVQVPPGVRRGEILRIPGEGMPRPRGGRGDLLARVTYRPGVTVSRSR